MNMMLNFLLVIVIIPISILNCQFIELKNKIKFYELRLHGNTGSNVENSFVYLVNNICTPYAKKKTDESIAIKNVPKYNASILMYSGVNSNLRLMIEVNINTIETPNDQIIGYEIKLTNILQTDYYCIRLLKIKPNFKLNSTIKFTLKDPDIFLPRTNTYQLFYGRLTVTPLVSCKLNHICAVTIDNPEPPKELNLLLPDVNDKFINDKEYQQRKFNNSGCYDELISETCTDIYRVSPTESYAIIAQPSLKHINKIENAMSIASDEDKYKFNSYRNESVNNIVYKIKPIGNFFYSPRSYLAEPTADNFCAKTKENIDNNMFCICGQACGHCYTYGDKPLRKSNLDNKDINFVGFKSHYHCFLNSFLLSYEPPMRTSFQNQPLLVASRQAAASNRFSLNDRLPQICINITKNENCRFADETESYDLNIKFYDVNYYAKSSTINLTYSIKFEPVKKNQTDMLDRNLTQISQNITNESEHKDSQQENQQRSRFYPFEQIKIIDLNQNFLIEKLHSGLYIIEIEPKVQSAVCKHLCPYEIQNGKLDEDNLVIKCEKCKVYTQLISISDGAFSSTNYKCMQQQKQDNDFFTIFNSQYNYEIDNIVTFDVSGATNHDGKIDGDTIKAIEYGVFQHVDNLIQTAPLCKNSDSVTYETFKQNGVHRTLMIVVAFGVFIIMAMIIIVRFNKKIEKQDLVILNNVTSMLKSDVVVSDGLTERRIEKLITILNRHFNVEYIDFQNEAQIKSIENLSSKYKTNNTIVYIARHQNDIDISIDLMQNQLTYFPIPQEPHQDYFYELFLNSQLSQKIFTVTFNNGIFPCDTLVKSETDTKLDYYTIPSQLKRLLSDLKQFNSVISNDTQLQNCNTSYKSRETTSAHENRRLLETDSRIIAAI